MKRLTATALCVCMVLSLWVAGVSPATLTAASAASAPMLSQVSVSADSVSPGDPVIISYQASCDGILRLGVMEAIGSRELATREVKAGSGSFVWDGDGLPLGPQTITLSLTDADGSASGEVELTVTVVEDGDEELLLPDASDEVQLEQAAPTVDQSIFTPSYASSYEGEKDTTTNYWTLPMDITDTEAVWNMLMQPMTVLDSGAKTNGSKVLITIRSEPSLDSKGVGVVTCITQGVHVLEKGKEWTLIECYSSSFHAPKVKAWNMLTVGYVQTKYLKTVTPYEHLAIVIDKLTQRLYIFQDGELYDTLLVSTGQANEKQPYNETRSGEFVLQCPAVGQFKSDNLYCDMAIRFNAGDLLHEVPHTEYGGKRSYKSTEGKLGTKASHGCIRVQRLKTAKGTNMKWIWDNRHNNMKIVIWEDWQGRQYPTPDDDTLLYYNPEGGDYYHTSADCQSTKKELVAFTYGELDTGDFAKLERCGYCAAPLRKAEINEINETYALGGDHDPILSAAQRKCADNLGLKNYYNRDEE